MGAAVQGIAIAITSSILLSLLVSVSVILSLLAFVIGFEKSH